MLKTAHILSGPVRPVTTFNAPEADGGGSVADLLLGESLGSDDEDEDESVGETPIKTEPENEKLPVKPEVPALDPEDISNRVAEKLKPKPEQKEMTPAERNALLKIWEPDDAWLSRFDDPLTRRDALVEMLNRQREHQNLMLQAIASHLQTQFQSQLNPIQQSHVAASRNQVMGRFAEQYPTLVEPKYKDLLKFALSELKEQNFESEAAGFKALASRVEQLVKNIDPNFSLSGSPAGAKPKKPDESRKLPVTRNGSGGSGGSKSDNEGGESSDIVNLLTRVS